MPRERLIPLIVAVALFMENMDSTVIATALPAIAADIGTSPLALKLAITSYLLALAIFIPASGWTADRFGARTIFRAAIAVFMCGSIACALAASLEHFVIARFVQGIGGAMMTPVGRVVLLRSVDKRTLVAAMTWVTMPALIGPLVGPPVGGFITTYFSWHWIFLINVPMGLLGIVLATRYIENIRVDTPVPFDLAGMILTGLGIGGLAFGLTVLGVDILPGSVVAGMIVAGAIFMAAYVLHARRTPAPILDLSLFALPTFRASIVGGSVFRAGVGALPFLMPLMLQVGFHMTPFHSGLVTFSTALGAMSMKAAVPLILKRFGFRATLTVTAVIAGALVAACGAFTPTTPILVMVAALGVGGFFRSLEFTSINTIAYADVDPPRISKATSIASVAQQLATSMGVAVGALAVEASVHFRHGATLTAEDFSTAFLFVGGFAALSALVFVRLPPDAGAELANRTPVPTDPTDQRTG
jgi:EmrB/QacA subfamily drug resistance transporter